MSLFFLASLLLLNCGAGTSPVGAPLGGEVPSLGGSPTAPTQAATQSDPKSGDNGNDNSDADVSARVLSRDVGSGDAGTTRNAGAPLSAGLPVPTNGFLGDNEGTPGYNFTLIRQTITPLTGKGQGSVENETIGQVLREKEKGGSMEGCCENQWMIFQVKDPFGFVSCVEAKVWDEGNFTVNFTGPPRAGIWPVAFLFNAGEVPESTSQGPCPNPGAMLPGINIASPKTFLVKPATNFVVPDLKSSDFNGFRPKLNGGN